MKNNNSNFKLNLFADFCFRAVLVSTLLRFFRLGDDGNPLRDDLQFHVYRCAATRDRSIREAFGRASAVEITKAVSICESFELAGYL